ncbi:expressed protein, partial [Phakopsora pachyrhizi]
MSGGISNSSQRYQTVRVLSKFLLMIIIPSIAIGQIQPTQNYLNHNSNNDQRHLCHGHHQTYQKDPSHDRSETLRDLSEPGEHHHHKVKKLSSPSSVPKQGNLQGGVDHDDLKERQDREKAVESVRGLITALRSERNPINFMFGTLRGLFKFLVVRLLYETLVLRGFGLVNFLVVSILWNSMINPILFPFRIMGLVLFIKPLELLTKILKKASPLFSLVFLAISLGSLIGLVSINVFKKISNHLHHNHHSHTSKISSSKRSKSVQKDLIDCSDDLKPDVIVQNASIKEEEERQKEFKLDKRSSPSKTLSTRSKDKNQKDISNSLSSSNPKKPRIQLFEKLRQISENYEDYDVDQEGFDDKIQSQTQSGTSSPFSSPLVFKGFE